MCVQKLKKAKQLYKNTKIKDFIITMFYTNSIFT